MKKTTAESMDLSPYRSLGLGNEQDRWHNYPFAEPSACQWARCMLALPKGVCE